MTLRKIALLGQPVLLRPAEPVADPAADDIRALVQDMRETLRDARGLGLAAPQVYAGVQVILAQVPAEDEAADRMAEPLVLINPRLTPLDSAPLESAMALGFEGCLSIPGLRGLVPRYKRVGLSALDERGRVVEREAEGLFARILQHEVDHLHGTLYTMRLKDPRHLAFDAEISALAAYLEEEAGKAGEDGR